jgi:glycogen synthase
MATGTPVIARRAGALPEIIEHGRTGFLVDDMQEAALAIERAADLNRRQIRQRALGRFSVERMLDDYERVFDGLVGGALRRSDGSERIPVMAERRTSRNRERAEMILEPASRREAN